MKTDVELLQSFKVSVEGNVVNVVVFQQEQEDDDYIRVAELSRDMCFKIFEENKEKIFHFIVDIGKVKDKIPEKSNKIYGAIAQHPQVDKAAIISQEALIKLVCNVIGYFTGKAHKIRCFASRPEALQWLEEK